MLKWIKRIDQWMERVEHGMAVVLYLLLITLISFTIIGRNVWHMASHRLLELAPAVVLWLALVGAAVALKRQRHIRIELLLRLLPASGRKVAHMVTSLFAMGVCGALAYAAIPFLLNEIVLFGPWGWLAICFPLFFSVAFMRFALSLLVTLGRTEEAP